MLRRKFEASEISGLILELLIGGNKAAGHHFLQFRQFYRCEQFQRRETERAARTQSDQTNERVEPHMDSGINHLLGQIADQLIAAVQLAVAEALQQSGVVS